ncbi:hypothetical protein XENOCAPTIV_012552 [Xenoophorus captivus]|uniref:Uncharacterized protein n=1 Tax=Xenoophorus captivus TaxID=1517983 RepID=A0ABV0RS25_9TELE
MYSEQSLSCAQGLTEYLSLFLVLKPVQHKQIIKTQVKKSLILFAVCSVDTCCKISFGFQHRAEVTDCVGLHMVCSIFGGTPAARGIGNIQPDKTSRDISSIVFCTKTQCHTVCTHWHITRGLVDLGRPQIGRALQV